MPRRLVQGGERPLQGGSQDVPRGLSGLGRGAALGGRCPMGGSGRDHGNWMGGSFTSQYGCKAGDLPQLAHVRTIKRRCDTHWDAGAMKEKSVIALVDDERNILTSLGMALEAEGYKVRTYSDGAA